MTKTALVVLADGFEEIETVSPIDILRRANVDVCVAALTQMACKGRSNIIMQADALLDDAKGKDYDCLVLPGGPGTKLVREDARVIELVKKYVAAGKKVCAICAAPTVLKEAGVLPKRYTAHHSVADVLTEILPERVVVDGNMITSAGAGTSVEFGLAIVAELCDKDTADKISKAISFT